MKKFVLSLLLCLGVFRLWAQQIDTVEVFSKAMNRAVKNIVILPSDYLNRENLPVIYLLHGYSKDYHAWLDINPELPRLASYHGVIMVCPDGKNSWYFDSPIKPDSRYETYVSEELVQYMDSHYKTKTDKSGRAITGFSMGGHGAMWVAIRHQDRFGACGATSGGLDFRSFPESWEIKDVLGDYYTNNARWDSHTVINQLHLIKPGLAILFDCGTEDFFHEVNERLHKEMEYRNIKHDYISRPGIHDYEYWNRAIVYQLQFFADYFNGKNTYEVKLRYSND